MEWTAEMKIKLVKIDVKRGSKAKKFMKRVKQIWDLEFLEQASVSTHNLRNNTSHFQKNWK